MPSTRIKIKRERDPGVIGDFRSDFDTVSIEFSWGAGASEMVEKFVGLLCAMGYAEGAVLSAMQDHLDGVGWLDPKEAEDE